MTIYHFYHGKEVPILSGLNYVHVSDNLGPYMYCAISRFCVSSGGPIKTIIANLPSDIALLLGLYGQLTIVEEEYLSPMLKRELSIHA